MWRKRLKRKWYVQYNMNNLILYLILWSSPYCSSLLILLLGVMYSVAPVDNLLLFQIRHVSFTCTLDTGQWLGSYCGQDECSNKQVRWSSFGVLAPCDDSKIRKKDVADRKVILKFSTTRSAVDNISAIRKQNVVISKHIWQCSMWKFVVTR